MTFNFSKTNMSLETINKYLESQGIELTSDEKKQIKTIFQESDTWNAVERSEGKDGILNSIEASTFSLKINNALPKLKAKIDSLIENLGLKFEAPKRDDEVAPAVSTRVDISNYETVQETENIKAEITEYSRDDILNIAIDQTIKRMPELKGIDSASKRINIIKKKFPDVYNKALNKANKVTDMVMKNCKKYNITELTPIIVTMLSVETGGFCFTPRVMKNSRSQYKGVMQVNLDAIKTLYKDKSSSNARFIEELKGKYKTPGELYSAIQTNVELGLQVGILFFKTKLRGTGGNVAKGIKSYCGGQYSYDYSLKTPDKINIHEM